MSIRKTLFIAMAAVLTTAVCAFAQGTTTTTTSTFTRTETSPPIGLGNSETFEILVANTAANSTSGAAASCAVSVSFVNASGAVIGTATSLTLTSGQISAVRLAYANSGTTAGRALIRGAVTLTETSGSQTPCELETSFATFDSTTGATHVLLAGQAAGNPGPMGR